MPNDSMYIRTEGLDYESKSQMKLYFGKLERKKNIFKKYVNNRISTTKYNILSFFPKSILIQFQRIANVYFLAISVLTFMSFSPKEPASMIGTFAIVIIFTMLKEAFEDYKRYKQDNDLNRGKSAKIYTDDAKSDSNLIHKYWEDIRVGDLVLIGKDEDIPADVLFLKSSLDTGMCFIDTMNLDGETNLKEKMIPQGLKSLQKNDVITSSGSLICNLPDENLEKWECNLFINKFNNNISCSLKQLILRGSSLRNTEWIIGLVVYTGHNTKIMKNSKSPPIKISNIMRTMNTLLYSVFIFQLLLCVIFSIVFIIWQNSNKESLFYIQKYGSADFQKILLTATFKDLVLKFFTFLVAYSNIIPISLYVALEIVKLIQSLLIFYDEKCVDPVSLKPAIARTSDLIEELGQVEFIFSDKTGTLTKNEMEFRKCYINDSIYGETENISDKIQNSVNGDEKGFDILTGKSRENNQNDKVFIKDFFTILAVCHSAYIDVKDGKKFFQSSSPDEVALLEGAKLMGFEFQNKTSETIDVITYSGENQIWELILELPFDSTRKRMSVIVKRRDVENSEYFVFCKGADSAMLNIIEEDEDLQSKISDALMKFAKEGLRTLVIAKKQISEKEVELYVEENRKINMSTKTDKDTDLLDLYNRIEKGFSYIGSSAIEDKLQDGVPETIETLMKADIRIWVLTGDKKETALEIGKSCRLIQDESVMDAINLASSSDKGDTKDEFIEKFEFNCKNFMSRKNKSKKLYIIIDGSNLCYVLADLNLSKKFFNLGMNANSVICCRVSPKQKSLVVKLAKDNGKWITLSIGDGANDVPMIMEAHIGVGIIGKEGAQANRSADYAIGQFRFLQRLLLIHGRWGYRRISLFICYYFYKNIVSVFTELYFAIFTGFSGQTYFPDLLPMCYNAFWTSWPCIVNYSIEKDVDEISSVKYPKLYNAGQKGFYFNMKKFWTWILFAFFHGVILFFMISYGVNTPLSVTGKIMDHWVLSSLSFSCVITVVTMKIFVDAMYWNYMNLFISLLSVLFYYFCMFIMCSTKISQMFQNELISKIGEILSNYKTLASLIVIPILTLVPDFTYKLIQVNFSPNPVEHLVNSDKINEVFEDSMKIPNETNRKLFDDSKENSQLDSPKKKINNQKDEFELDNMYKNSRLTKINMEMSNMK